MERESLESRGLTTDDLIVPVQVIDKDQLAELMEEQEVILSF